MNGGVLPEEPPMPKLEFRYKECLENFEIFAKVLEWVFGENGSLFIGLGWFTLERNVAGHLVGFLGFVLV